MSILDYVGLFLVAFAAVSVFTGGVLYLKGE